MGQLTEEFSNHKFWRGIFFGLGVVFAAAITSCGGVVGSLTSAPPPPAVQSLTAADVTALIGAAAQAADPNTMVIAVVDRSGDILGVYRKPPRRRWPREILTRK